MAYRVRFTRRALRDLDRLYSYTGAVNSEPARRWLNGLEERIATLAIVPHSGSMTHEKPEVRQLLYGNKPHLYRVLYRTTDEAQEVRILSIWHGRRQPPPFLSGST